MPRLTPRATVCLSATERHILTSGLIDRIVEAKVWASSAMSGAPQQQHRPEALPPEQQTESAVEPGQGDLLGLIPVAHS